MTIENTIEIPINSLYHNEYELMHTHTHPYMRLTVPIMVDTFCVMVI